MANPELSRDELEAALRARHELDRELEPHVIDAPRSLERNIDARGRAAAGARRGRGRPGEAVAGVIARHGDPALGSMFLGVLATAAVADLGSATAQVVIAIFAWIAIVAVNVVHARR